MSDVKSSIDGNDDAPAGRAPTGDAPTSPAPAPQAKKGGRWRRRMLWTLLVLVVGTFALRAVLTLVLPTLVSAAVAPFGLNCSYERSQLNLLSGDAELWHVVLTPKEPGAGGAAAAAPVIATEYCRVNLSPLMLLRGKIVVWRVEADGVDVDVERMPDGTVPLLDRFVSGMEQSSAASDSSDSGLVDLTPRLRLDALRLTQVKARLRDRAVTPPVEADVVVDMRVSDVGWTTRPSRFTVEVQSSPLVDLLVIDGRGSGTGRAVDSDVDVRLRGLNLRALGPYLASLGLNPVAERIDATCVAHLRGDLVPNAPDTATGTAVIEKVVATVDGREAVGVDRVSIDVTSVNTAGADVASLLVDGVRLRGARNADGLLEAMGVQLVGAPAAQVADAPASPPQPGGPATAPAGAAFKWKLAKANVKNVRATFDDEAIAPAAQLAFHVDDLSASNIIADGTASAVVVPVTGRFSAPGVVRAIALDGRITLMAPTKTAALTIRAEGIVPEALRAYLDSAGIESRLVDGTFVCELNAALTTADDGTMRGDADLAKLSFADGEQELLSIAGGTIKGVELAPNHDRVRIASIELSGPNVQAVRRATGEIDAVGFRARAASAAAPAHSRAPATAPATRPAAPGATVAIPAIELGRFVWKDIKLAFDDQAASPPTRITVADAGVELTDLTIDLRAERAGTPGKLKAWLSAPGLAEKFSVDGTISPQPRALAGTLTINGSGITAAALKPYLAGLGIEPVLKDGSLAMTTQFALRRSSDDVLSASLGVDKLALVDAGAELAGIDALRIDGVELRPDELAVGEVRVDRPRAAALREADGSLVAAGVRLRMVPATPSAGAASHATAPKDSPALAAAMPAVSVKKLQVNDAALDWTDRAARDEFHTVAHVNAELDDLSMGRDGASPATLRLAIGADGVVESATVKGTVLAAPSAQSAKLIVEATGIRGGALAPYLPAGTTVALEQGEFRGAIEAMLTAHKEGGHAASLVVSELSLRDAAQGDQPPLVALGNATVRVQRFDLAGKVIAVDEISTAGLETQIKMEQSGAVRAGALRLEPAPATVQAEPGAQLAAMQSQRAAQPATQPAGAAPTTAPAAAELIAQARQPLPLVTVAKLDVNVKRVTIEDETRPQAARLAVADMRVRNVGRIEAAGPDAENRPPAVIDATMRVEPVADSVALKATLAPFAAEPVVKLDFAADGVRGDGLTKLVPQLAEHIDGSTMTSGSARGQLEVHAKLDRRVWQDLDFSRPLEADVLLSALEFRAAPDGPVLAGLAEVRADKVRVEPRTGAVHAKSLEINKPVAMLTRDAEGLHVLGCVVKLSNETEGAPTTQPELPPSASLADATNRATNNATNGAPAAPRPAAKPAAEIRVDRLLVSGLDARFEDTSVEPNLIVPLTGLDMEVRGLSNLVLYEDRPIRFSALLNSGKVAVRQRDGTVVDRELFAQAAASGRVSLYPSPSGWVKSSVSGLELASLAGPAKQAGVELGGGVFDASADVRLRPDNVMDARTKSTVTDLKVSESPDGPIKRTLQLPAPLDAVVVALQDPSGSINVPLNVSVKDGELSRSAIAAAAAAAFAPIVATAVASAPLKVVGGAGSMIGMGGGGKKQRRPEEPIVVTFVAGDVALEPAQDAAIARVVERMRRDPKMEVTLRHDLGADDVARLGLRANPDAADSANLAYQLRQRKAELLAERSRLAGQAKGELIAGGRDGESLARLRALDGDIARTEDALDHVYDLLRPGADRQADRRTRAACLEVGQARLGATKDALLAAAAAADEDVAARVRVVNAQAAPGDAASGRVTITMIPKKKSAAGKK